eukprot:TRINITY_DN3254_c0_g2_i2.p1 TRINITY_DN3254_c0_g2~~TRINITY_DN3254_c0_g2_i2.p1  ORF type:complete len:407 (-),score=38.32 TRINITY_DN3254_c0_g2_i2:186-1406(-)
MMLTVNYLPQLSPNITSTTTKSRSLLSTPKTPRLRLEDSDDQTCTKCKRPRNLLVTRSCNVSPVLSLTLPKKILSDVSKEPTEYRPTLENLPTEILVHILRFVATDTKAIFTLEAVSIYWQKLARSVVTKVCMADFRHNLQSPLYTPNLSRRTKALRGSSTRGPHLRKRYTKDLVDDLFVWRVVSRYGVGNIRVLDLSSCGNLTNRLLHHLSSVAKNLSSLDLTSCTGITESGLAHLVALPRLRKLDLTGCSNINDNGIRHLIELKSLEKLVLWGAQISDESLSYLAKCDSLRSLYLYPLSESGAITAKGTSYLGSSSLRSIYLYGEFITDSFLKIFIAPLHLEGLHIHYPHPEFQGSDIIPLLMRMPPSFHTLSISGLLPNFDRVKLQNDLAELKSLDRIKLVFE